MTHIHNPQCDCDECHPMERCPCGRPSVRENGDCDLCAVGKEVDGIERAATAGYTLSNIMWLSAAVRKYDKTIRKLEERKGLPDEDNPTFDVSKTREPTYLQERVVELRAWAKARIAEDDCVLESGSFYLEVISEARTERRALQAVLRILNSEETPVKSTAEHFWPEKGPDDER